MRGSGLHIMLVMSAMAHGAVIAGLVALGPYKSKSRGVALSTSIEITVEPAPRQRLVEPPVAEPRPVEPAGLSDSPGVAKPTVVRLPGPAAEKPRVPRVPAMPPDAPPQSSSTLLAMRARPAVPGASEPDPRISLDLSPERAAQAVAGSEPSVRSPLALPGEPREQKRLMEPAGNGTYRFEHPGFTARVERDGRVRFEDKPSVQPFAEGPCLSCVKRDLSRYAADPMSGNFVDPLALLPKVGARFDVTDWAIRRSGADPYSYEKKRFLDATRDQRAAMREREAGADLRESLHHLRGYLGEIWAHDAWLPAERRRALFQLWDECEETGPQERVRVGRQIRATIIAFIRKKLPAGTEYAYTTAELDALNAARTSREIFAPYGSQQTAD